MTIFTSMRAAATQMHTVSGVSGIPRLPGSMFKAIQRPGYNVAAVITPQNVRWFYKDVGLGANSGLADRHFIANGLSTDTSSIVTHMIKFDGPKHEERLKEYKEAYEKVNGRLPSDFDIMGRYPWQVLKFSDRRVLENSDIPYVDYYREAVRTSIAREGKVHFYLGQFDTKEYVHSIVKTEAREKKSFAEFAANVDYPTLVNLGKGEQWSPYGGVLGHGDGDAVEQPKITSVELYDATLGEFSDKGKGFEYYAENGTRLDTEKLLQFQHAALEEARKPENVELLLADKPMTAEAQKAIENLQAYINHGAAQHG